MALADTARLIASLELQDKFSGPMGKALGQLGQAEGRFSRIGGIAAKGVGTAITNISRLGLVAAGAIGAAVFSGIQSLEELERVTNATEGVIESTGGKAGVTAEQVRELAQSLEELTTADDKVIQSGQNLLLTFTNIGGDVFPEATRAMVNLGIAMAQGDVANADFKSSAIQIGKALNDPIKGITALTRVGVSFTEEQKNQIKAMVEAGDVAGAQKIILQELAVEFGNAGEAAGKGFGGDMRRFQDAIEDAKMALATGFLPVLQEITKFLKEKLSDPKVITAIKEFGVGAAGLLKDAFEGAKKIPWQQVGDAFKLMGQGAKAAFDIFMGMPEWVKTAVITGWGLNKLTGGAVTGIIGELGKGLIKGVLGMTAGVVNIKAGAVTGVGTGGAGAPVGGTATKGGAVVSSMKVLGSMLIAGVALDQLFQQWGRFETQVHNASTSAMEQVATIPDKTYTQALLAVDQLNTNINTNSQDLIAAMLQTTGTGRGEAIAAFEELARNLLSKAETPEDRAAALSALNTLKETIATKFTALGTDQDAIRAQLGGILTTTQAQTQGIVGAIGVGTEAQRNETARINALHATLQAKNFRPTINVPVNINNRFTVSARTIANEIVRYRRLSTGGEVGFF